MKFSILLIAIFANVMMFGCSGGDKGASESPKDPSSSPKGPTIEDGLKGAPGDFIGVWNSQTCSRTSPGIEPSNCELMIKVKSEWENTFTLVIFNGSYTENLSVSYTGNDITPSNPWAVGKVGSNAMQFEYDYNPYDAGKGYYAFEMLLTGPKTAEVKWRRTVFKDNVPTTYEYTATIFR